MMKKHQLYIKSILSGVLLSISTHAAAQHKYNITGTCDGLPRIDVSTPPGLCVGIAATGFVFPRTVTQLNDGSLILVDMGGWAPRNGSIWKLQRAADGKSYSKIKLMDKLPQPHGSALGADGLVYIGILGKVFRFNPHADNPSATIQDVITNLPATGRHPLVSIAFDKSGALLVNQGSASDNCEISEGKLPNPSVPCAEAEGLNARGAVRRYVLSGPNRTGTTWTVFARGLRNSMAIAVHPQSGLVVQGENSRDAIHKVAPQISDVTEPKEELNILEAGSSYGWPYCYDNNTPAPEYPGHNCSKHRAPTLLMPGHVAPLGMTYYTGQMLPPWYRNKLLMTWHGYRHFGQKLVAVSTDETGRPKGEIYEIIYNWGKKGSQNLGAPVGVTVAKDGALFIAEDKNKVLLRVAYVPSEGNGIPIAGVSQTCAPEQGIEERCKNMAMRHDAFTEIQRTIIDTDCASCHGSACGNAGSLRLAQCDDIGNARALLAGRPESKPFVIPGDLKSELYLRMEGKTEGLPPMPAGGASAPKLAKIKDWIMSGAPVPGALSSANVGKAISKEATVLKKRPDDSSALTLAEKCSLPTNETLTYKSKQPAAKGHVRLILSSPSTKCKNTSGEFVKFEGEVYVFEKHFKFEP